MSVLIKGMKMPKNCDDCFLSEWSICNERFYCPLDDCPLVEVPTPHGRLIDADALIAQMKVDEEQMKEPTTTMFIYAFISNVMHAPTVIEAEEGEDE